MSYQQLTEGQRYQISVLLAEGLSFSQIAQKVGVHRSTISRELRRNGQDHGYVPADAHQQTPLRRRQAAKRQIDEDTRQVVEMLLSLQSSPEQVSRVGFPVSHEWIYRHVATDKRQGGQLYRHLRQGHKRYRKGQHAKHSPILEGRSIDERPAIVDNRERLGYWEADTVIG